METILKTSKNSNIYDDFLLDPIVVGYTSTVLFESEQLGLRSISYNFETIQGKVYIAGITSRPKQLDQIIEATKTIKGVKEIVNYVIIKE